jgi:REP element-mobilizing transposase RayT
MEPIKEGFFYHIYNRGAGKSDLFWTDDDFSDFMDKYVYYLNIPAEMYAYCLLKNHFHFLIRVRTVEEQKTIFQVLKEPFMETTSRLQNHLMSQNSFHTS